MKQAMNMVPSNEELNNMLARSPEEKVLFDRMDREHAWPVIPTGIFWPARPTTSTPRRSYL